MIVNTPRESRETIKQMRYCEWVRQRYPFEDTKSMRHRELMKGKPVLEREQIEPYERFVTK